LSEVDDGILRLEAYTEALELEIKERIEVINVLEVSEQYYDTQKGEAKVVCNVRHLNEIIFLYYIVDGVVCARNY
jgi:hypothetical protein